MSSGKAWASVACAPSINIWWGGCCDGHSWRLRVLWPDGLPGLTAAHRAAARFVSKCSTVAGLLPPLQCGSGPTSATCLRTSVCLLLSPPIINNRFWKIICRFCRWRKPVSLPGIFLPGCQFVRGTRTFYGKIDFIAHIIEPRLATILKVR